MLKNLVLKNRSYRRFYEDQSVDLDTLKELVNLARLTPSAANKQPLKYMFIHAQAERDAIFPCLLWAGALKDWSGPEEGERPAAYIVVLGDQNIRKNIPWDYGIAAQTIMLGAAEKGLGGCMIGALRKKELRAFLHIPEQYEISLVLALGRPKEQVVLEPLPEDGNVNYWRDSDQVHHVPKRSLEDVIL